MPLMRPVAVALLLLPLVAGCSGPAAAPAPVLEAFDAIYRMPGAGDASDHYVNVSFGRLIPYVDADGEVRQGYAVDIDHGQRAATLCSGQSVLDGNLAPRRLLFGNGWDDSSVCVREEYVWAGSGPDAAVPQFGIGLAYAPPPDVERSAQDGEVRIEALGRTYVFGDATLAPTAIRTALGDWVPRVAYTSRGPLPALGPDPVQPLPLQPPGNGLPGDGIEVPWMPFTLRAALDYLAASDEQAAATLQRGCLAAFFHNAAWVEPTDSTVVPPLGDVPYATIHLTLVADGVPTTYEVEYGRRFPSREATFLSAQPVPDSAQTWSIDCAKRPPVASLAALSAQITGRDDAQARFVSGTWREDPAGLEPTRFHLTMDTSLGRAVADGNVGLLASWSLPRGAPIDPAPGNATA